MSYSQDKCASPTPGPWEIHTERSDPTRRFVWPPRDIDAGEYCIATIEPRNTVEELEANAFVIAAAFDLHKLVREFARLCAACGGEGKVVQGRRIVRCRECEDIRAAIARAEGRS